MSEDPEELTPYDLTADPKAYVFLQPGWAERFKELTPRAGSIAPSGPSAMQCIEAAMRADPSLTTERAVTEVTVSAEALERYERAAEARWLAEFGPVAEDEP